MANLRRRRAALKRAIKYVGGQKPLADRLSVIMRHNVSQPLIRYWLVDSQKGVAAEAVIAVEQATDGEVSRHDLRPDIYPLEDA